MNSWKLGNPPGPKAGVLLIALSAVAAVGLSTEASAQTLTMLHSFSGSDGAGPVEGPIFECVRGTLRHDDGGRRSRSRGGLRAYAARRDRRGLE